VGLSPGNLHKLPAEYMDKYHIPAVIDRHVIIRFQSLVVVWGRCINYIFCVLVLPVLIDCKKCLRIPKMVVIRSRELKEDKQHNGVRFIVFNATLNSISVISWWSVLLV
jgi:hypothetical protein